QPAERYTWHDEDGREREGLILYALGDLMCQLPQVAFSALGALARVQLMRCSDDSVAIHSVELKPYYAYRRNGEKGTCVDARLLDFRSLEKRIAAGEFESDPELNPAQVKALRKLSPVLEDILPRT
ncbi:MAG: hypothetical protein LBS98_05370, partial [Coriobacteriales bacterium]|nr:hypothetical protein [Coriobacteriales bacterium]